MINDSVKNSPFCYSSIVWMIIFPDIMKIICLTLTDTPFWIYVLSSIHQYMLQSFLYSYTGVTLKHFKDTTTENGCFSDMSTSQKIQFISTCAFVAVSFIVI